MKVLLIAGLADSLITFRGPLIAALRARGHDVHVAAPSMAPGEPVGDRLRSLGLQVHDIPLRRAGMNPVHDLRSLLSLWSLMRRVRPELVLGYTIKPVIYGSIAAWIARVPRRHALITGLGFAFTGTGDRSLLMNLVGGLYRFALGRTHHVFFQNPDDQALFLSRGILRADTPSSVVNGSGVDLGEFAVAPVPAGPPAFLLIARLLGDKGVREYVAAARRIRSRWPGTRFMLAGWIDENPDAISPAELEAWQREGVVEFLGRLADVRPALSSCAVYVLPSYREGTPRTVLEAMATGRAIITTDAPGCRETVVDSVNGFLVPIKSADALERAMARFLEEPVLIAAMGARSREIVERKYDVDAVNAVMLEKMRLA